MDKKGLMFDFVSCTKNPLGGECYGCYYCYIFGRKGMKTRFKQVKAKYSGEPRLYESVLNERLKNVDLCFLCSAIDYLRPDISNEMIYRIFEFVERNKDVLFLSLSKNPIRYLELVHMIPDNMILGATIESNINYPQYSNAPSQLDRIKAMINIANNCLLSRHYRFLSVEPILKFNYEIFLAHIEQINPNFGIAMGYDNHHYKLDEPSYRDYLSLRTKLIHYGFRIFDKTQRKAWWE